MSLMDYMSNREPEREFRNTCYAPYRYTDLVATDTREFLWCSDNPESLECVPSCLFLIPNQIPRFQGAPTRLNHTYVLPVGFCRFHHRPPGPEKARYLSWSA